MNLNKALKYKNTIVSEINSIKGKILKHNSYLDGNISSEKFDIVKATERLTKLVNTLVNLKISINEANRNLYPIIYSISEYKALIVFWKEVECNDGTKLVGYSENLHTYKTHMTEDEKDIIILNLQKKVNQLQDDIDEYNLTNSFEWDFDLI